LNSKKQEKIKLDQIMKVLFKLSKKVMVNLMNSLFDENFLTHEVTINYGNSEFVNDDLDRIYGDIFITIRKKTYEYRYHIEFQTTNDNSMVIRMFRYGFEKALELSSTQQTEEIRLDFPKQLVIFLEENDSIKDYLSFKLILPDKGEVKYNVPVIKYWKYSAQDLKDKKMYALLPLQVFKSRKTIMGIYNSRRKEKEKAQLINEEFKKLLENIRSTIEILKELNEEQEIYVSDLEKILRVLTNITDYLYNKYGKYTQVGKEVYNMVTTLYNPAIENKGRMEGRVEGKIEFVLDLLADYGKIDLDLEKRIKSETNISVVNKWVKLAARVNSIDEFAQKME
jgi:antitoxin component HigA of HigAB toxin-antitoxin module